MVTIKCNHIQTNPTPWEKTEEIGHQDKGYVVILGYKLNGLYKFKDHWFMLPLQVYLLIPMFGLPLIGHQDKGYAVYWGKV
jgi:hypothetical protein